MDLSQLGDDVWNKGVREFTSGPQQGKLVVLAEDLANDDFYVVRLNSNGALDQGFGSNGVVTLANTYVYTYTLTREGEIVYVAGTGSGQSVRRLRADGSMDSGFGLDGSAPVADPTPVNFYAGCLKVYGPGPNAGQILYVTHKSENAGLGNYRTVSSEVRRLDPDGTPDASFGTGGVVDMKALGIPNGCPSVFGPNDSIRIVGTKDFNFSNSYLARLTADGDDDPAFNPGSDDPVKLPFAGGLLGEPGEAEPVLLGSTAPGDGRTLINLTRIDQQGGAIDGYGSGSPFEVLPSQIVSSAIDDHDRVSTLGAYRGSSLARFTAAGALDETFGFGGTLRFFWPSSLYTESSGLVAQNDGMVVAGSHIEEVTQERTPFVARFADDQDPSAAVPQTKITGPVDGSRLQEPVRAFVDFDSSDPDAVFDCAVASPKGNGKFRPCRSPYEPLYDPPLTGRVSFSVSSTSIYGVEDKTPATVSYTIGGDPKAKIEDLNVPSTLDGVKRRGIRAKVSCDGDCAARLLIHISQHQAEAFGLSSSLIAAGSRNLKALKPQVIVAHLRPGVADALAANPDRTVKFRATVESRWQSDSHKVSRTTRSGKLQLAR